MTYQAEVLADTPLVYWRCEESSGTTMADATGNGRTATLSGTYTLQQAGLITGAEKSISLAGGLGTANDAAFWDVDQFTLECWINHDGFGDTQRILIRDFFGTTDPFNMVLVYLTGPTRWRIDFEHRTTVDTVQLQGPLLSPSTIYHIVMTYDGTAMRIYVNGSQVASVARTGTTRGGGSVDWPVGVGGSASNGGLRYHGRIDEIAVYNYALGSTRVAAHYAAGSAIPINRATSTETAQALTPLVGGVVVPLGQAVETDTARALPLTGTFIMGRATETSTTASLVLIQDALITLGIATETNTAGVGGLALAVAQELITPWAYEQSDDFFFGRYKVRVGITLIKRDGHYEEVQYPWLGELAGLTDGEGYFLGGHQYTVSGSIRDDLIADGFL